MPIQRWALRAGVSPTALYLHFEDTRELGIGAECFNLRCGSWAGGAHAAALLRLVRRVQ